MMLERVQLLRSELAYDPPRRNSLQQALQGSVVPMVNQGPLRIAQAFLGPQRVVDAQSSRDEQRRQRAELRAVMRDFLDVCEAALELHSTILTEKFRKFHEMCRTQFAALRAQIEALLTDTAPTP